MAIQLELFGIPTRIQPWFFLTAFFLRPDRDPVHTLIWITVVLVGVLMHELGHAFAGRRFGFEPQIELFAFGGLTSWRVSRSLSPWRQLLISAAGPAVGLVIGSAALAVAIIAPPAAGSPAAFLVGDVVWVNLGWAVINLLPILPLDGGNIATSLAEMVWRERGRRVARVLSLAVTCLLVVWAISSGQLWIGVISAVLAWSNWQALRYERGAARQRPLSGDLSPELDELGAAFNSRRWTDVVAVAERLLATADSEDLRVHARYYLAWGLLSLGDAPGARKAVEELPSSARDSALEGSLLLAEGQPASAVHPLQEALAQGADPELEQAWSRAVLESGSWEEAISFAVSTKARRVSMAALSGLEQAAYQGSAFAAAAEMGTVVFAREPRPQTAFNVACSLSRAGRLDEAVSWLQRAVKSGLDDLRMIDSDQDLAPLRDLPEFQALRRRLER